MEPETTCKNNNTTETEKLYMAMELSQKEWKLGFSVGPGQAPRLRSVAGRDLGGLVNEIHLARERFGLGKDVEVASCYEAGRDGFWIHLTGGKESSGGLGQHRGKSAISAGED